MDQLDAKLMRQMIDMKLDYTGKISVLEENTNNFIKLANQKLFEFDRKVERMAEADVIY